MGFNEIVQQMREILTRIQVDLEKAVGGNKAASQRVRTSTVKLEKVAKAYRKQSIGTEKTMRKHGKKSGKAKAKAAPKAKAKTAKPKAAKTKGRSSSATVHARSMSVKRPTAKLPTAKRIRWS